MKFTIPQPALAAIIARGAITAPKSAAISVLSHCRITATADEVAIASTDMDRFAEASCGATVETEGAALVGAAALATLIGKHPKTADVTLEIVDDRVVVSCGRSKVKLPTLPAGDFPQWADEEPDAAFAISADDLALGVARVRFAAASDSTRAHLQGVYMHVKGDELRFAATDGFALIAMQPVPLPESAANMPGVVVPAEACDALSVFRGAAQIFVTVTKRAIGFSADSLRLCSRLIDTPFPDYERIIPPAGIPAISFKRADFVDCLDRANVLTGDGVFNSITARPEGGTIRLESRNNNGGEAVEELDAKIDDGFMPFGFVPRQAAAFMSKLNVEEITIGQVAAASPHLFTSPAAPGFIGMLSPVRVAA